MYSKYLEEIVEKNLIGCMPKNEEEVKFWKILNKKTDYFKISYADDTIYDISFNNASYELNLLYKQLLFIEALLNGGKRTTNTKLIANIFEEHAEVKVHNFYGTNEPIYEIGPIDNEYLNYLYNTLSFLDKRSNMSHSINYNNQNNISVHGDKNNINATNSGNINNSVKTVIDKIKDELPPVVVNQVEKEIEEYSNTGDPTSLVAKLKTIALNTVKFGPLITDILLLLQQNQP